MGLIITLIILGILLLLAEILIFPGVGVAGVLGVLLMGGACWYAFYLYGTTVGLIVTAVVVTLLILMMIWVLRAKTWKRMSLETNITAKAVVPEVELSVGDRGRSVTRLAPMGMARFGDCSVEVTAREGMIDPGVEVEVVAIDGNKVFVG